MSLIALDGDRVVSAALVWPVALRVGSEVVLGGQGTDAVTHPDYRGRPRLFLSLARTMKSLLPERGIDVYYTFPNERSIKLTKYVGGTYLGEVGAWGLELGRRRISLPRRRRTSEPAFEDAHSDELSPLIATAHAEQNVIRVDKSPTWLTWRYSKAVAKSVNGSLCVRMTGSLSSARRCRGARPRSLRALLRAARSTSCSRSSRGGRRAQSCRCAIDAAASKVSEARHPGQGSSAGARGGARRLRARKRSTDHGDHGSTGACPGRARFQPLAADQR